MRHDIFLLIPFETATGMLLAPEIRVSTQARFHLEVSHALSRFEAYVGRRLSMSGDADAPRFGGQPIDEPKRRSLSAVALSTHLESAGLTWETIDPGAEQVRWWRQALEARRHLDPHTVGISTTFMHSNAWIRTFICMVREVLPRAKIILGGYYYGTNAEAFLSLDADVFCVGTAETRLPEIVRRLRDGQPLESVSGLFLKRDGRMISTGPAHANDLQDLLAPDWQLCERIHPKLSLRDDYVVANVETQRGCVFKCTFCTHRTLQLHDTVSIDRAVDRIMDTAAFEKSVIGMTDSTATFPHERWEAILERLIAKGGSPHRIWAFGRVTDITERGAELMAKAGVRTIFLGQESGDQRMLHKMRKGTRIEHFAAAIELMSRNGLTAEIGMIHGFPGETKETARASRELLMRVNDGLTTPVALMYWLSPFVLQSFASIASPMLQADIDAAEEDSRSSMSVDEVVDECIRTVVEVSRVPQAPVAGLLVAPYAATAIADHPGRLEIHQWLKAVDEGIGMFLDERHYGRSPNMKRMAKLREAVLSVYPSTRRGDRKLRDRVMATANAAVLGRIRDEWAVETRGGSAGLLTRAIAAATTFADSGSPREAAQTFRLAEPVTPLVPVPKGLDIIADEFIRDSVKSASRVKLRVLDVDRPSDSARTHGRAHES